MAEGIKSEWKFVWEFLWNRFKFPAQSVAFILYFFTVIVLIGLLASFITVYSSINLSYDIDWETISMTLIGYSLVLLCSSAIEFIFIGFKEDESNYITLKNPITMIGVASLLFGIVSSIIVYFINFIALKVGFSIVMTLIVWFMWWVSNSRTLSVLSDYPPDKSKSTGGDTNQPLSGNIPKGYTS